MKTELLEGVKEREKDLASFILNKSYERINYFESDGILTYIVLEDGSRVKIDLFLHQLEKVLSPKVFYRCGWSFIVNLTKIHEYWVLEYPFLVMENGEIIPVPQSEKEAIGGLISRELIMRKD
jgi:DNA-binding LytR/AlgR family response regulator